MITTLNVSHVEAVSKRSFGEIVAALRAVTISGKNSFYHLAALSRDTVAFTKTFESHEGSRCFMRFLADITGAAETL